MGIPGLLPYVKKACYEGNLSEFEGKSVLVDASCLLHRGLFGCADKIALGQDTEFYIGYVTKYVNYLLRFKCHVILVFDGRPLPAKKVIHDSRRETRGKYQQLGEHLMNQGLTAEAYKAFSRGTELTSEIVEKTIKAFNRMPNVDVIVAPYEADAQIAYLMQAGYAHTVVTEDSDLIVFGCEKIIFKMNPSNGSCLIYDKKNLANCLCPLLRRRFKFETFRRICILAGCDYLQGGLQGVGLKGAEEIFAKTNQPELKTLLPRLPLYLNKRLRMKIDRNFVNDFILAENTFLHQIVFDPLTRQQRPLNSYPNCTNTESVENSSPSKNVMLKFDYAGKIVNPQKALRLAIGNPEKLLSLPTIEDKFTLPIAIPTWSIWSEQYKNVMEKENEERERRLDERFGAFQPTRSPVKRPSAALVDLSLSSADILEMEEKIESNAKRRRLSDIQIGTSPKNGVYLGWTQNDWMRMYGCDDTKKREEHADDEVTELKEEKENDGNLPLTT